MALARPSAKLIFIAAPSCPDMAVGFARRREGTVQGEADRRGDLASDAFVAGLDLRAIQNARGGELADVERDGIALLGPGGEIGPVRLAVEGPRHLPFAARQFRPQWETPRPSGAAHLDEPRAAAVAHFRQEPAEAFGERYGVRAVHDLGRDLQRLRHVGKTRRRQGGGSKLSSLALLRWNAVVLADEQDRHAPYRSDDHRLVEGALFHAGVAEESHRGPKTSPLAGQSRSRGQWEVPTDQRRGRGNPQFAHRQAQRAALAAGITARLAVNLRHHPIG